MSFERKVIFEDTRLRDLSNRQAKEKLELLNKAVEWCKIKGVKLETKKEKEEFKIDFVEFFKKKFYSINGTKTGLPLNVNKLMDLLDINILELQRILDKYLNNPIRIQIRKGEYSAAVTPEKYVMFTKTELENEMLEAMNEFVESLKKIEKYKKVYPFDICRGTSRFMNFDTSTGKYFLNTRT